MSEDSTPARPSSATAGPGAEEVAAGERASADVLAKHDTSSRYRKDLGWWVWVVGGLSIAFTVYHLYAALERPFNTWMHTSLHLAGATALIFFLYPPSR
ncbi:MAG: TRAP transporter permease, partial [Brevibacterium linens]